MWCINCSLHKLRVSFVTSGLSPLKKFQRDSFVKCISSSANISTGILHQKCANKSPPPPMCATSHERTKGQNAGFSVQLSRGQFILTFLSEVAAFEWLVTKVANGCTKVLAEHFHVIIANKFQAHHRKLS